MVKGMHTEADYDEFLQEVIAPAVEDFKITNADALIGLMTFRHPITPGRDGFKIPVLKRGDDVVQRLGEFGRAAYMKSDRDELEFAAERYGISVAFTEDALARALDEGVVDPIQNELRHARLLMSDKYGATIKTPVISGWGDAEDAPKYADRTFANHSHLINDGGTGDGDLQGDAQHFPENAANTDEVLRLSTIRGAKSHVSEHGQAPDTMIVSDFGLNDILTLLETQGVGSPLLPATIEGSVGRLYGMNIFVTPWMNDNTFVIVDSRQKPIVFGERESLELRTERNLLERKWDGQMMAAWVFGMVHKWAGIAVTYDSP